jgi:anti-anti-sigma factor
MRMQLSSENLDGNIVQIKLSGRMDIDGTHAIEHAFAALTGATKGQFLIDLSGVYFMASVGMRALIVAAKAQAFLGGKLVLYKPEPVVGEALITAGIAALVPICDDMACARRELSV